MFEKTLDTKTHQLSSIANAKDSAAKISSADFQHQFLRTAAVRKNSIYKVRTRQLYASHENDDQAESPLKSNKPVQNVKKIAQLVESNPGKNNLTMSTSARFSNKQSTNTSKLAKTSNMEELPKSPTKKSQTATAPKSPAQTSSRKSSTNSTPIGTAFGLNRNVSKIAASISRSISLRDESSPKTPPLWNKKVVMRHTNSSVSTASRFG